MRLIHITPGKLIWCVEHQPEEQQEALVSQVGQSWFQLDKSMEVGLWTSTNITSQTTGKLSDKDHQLNVITFDDIHVWLFSQFEGWKCI